MWNQFRNRNFYLVFIGDLLLFTGALWLAFGVRFAFEFSAASWQRIGSLLPLILMVKSGSFLALGVYRGMWRYISIPDAVRLAKATVLATLIIMSVLTITHHFRGFSRTIFLADCIFTLFFCGGLRLIIRAVLTRKGVQYKFWERKSGDSAAPRSIRLLVIGAGDAADSIIREIQGSRHPAFSLVACIDDDLRKHGQTLLDVPVRGPISKLPLWVHRFRAEEILIAMPSVVGPDMRRIIAACKATNLPFKTLPLIGSLVDGQVTVNDVREVEYEDILGRSPVHLDHQGIGSYLTDKTIVVTGAGGSIGAELCRQILRFKPARLVLVDASEFNLYQIEQELHAEHRFHALEGILGRVQDRALMTRLCQQCRPQVIFHAAACKHVPMVELNPREGLLNNVLGSLTMMDIAAKFQVERFVLVSTDKAVRPTNIMGATKRIAEMALQARPATHTRFMAVRFGNVLGSSGSVIPLFRKQIRAGGPITVTHPDITRYFMMISEACQLILQAGAMGQGGEIFILEMGTPIKIADMARDMIRLSGKVPDQDITILYTGLRPGEKLFEELITQGEGITPTEHEKIMVLQRDAPPADSSHEWAAIQTQVNRLLAAADLFNHTELKAILREMVPEYQPAPDPPPNRGATTQNPANVSG